MDSDIEAGTEAGTEVGTGASTESQVNAEPGAPGLTVDVQSETARPITRKATPWIADSMEMARALLSLWEHRADKHSGAPGSVHASSDFFLPFLAANDCYLSPHIALWESGGVPCGILIARIAVSRPKRAIGPITVPMPRLKNLEIVHGGLEADTEGTTLLQLAYIREILATGKVDAISIHHLPCDSEAGKRLLAGLRGPGDGSPALTSHWFTELSDVNGEPVISNSSKTRSSFRRKDRKLEKLFLGPVQVRELNSEQDVTPLIVAAAGIGERSYQGGLGVGVRNNTHWQTVLSILAANGHLRGYLLEADGATLAYGVGAACHGTFCYMAGSFLPEYRDVAPGGYLLRRMFERLQDQGIRWFDFGFGDAAYKELYGNLCREEATLHLYAKSRPAQTARLLDGLVQRSNRGVRTLLSSTGLLESARRLWRRRLERRQ